MSTAAPRGAERTTDEVLRGLNLGVAATIDEHAAMVGGFRSCAREPAAAGQLWALSEKLVGESFAWGVDA